MKILDRTLVYLNPSFKFVRFDAEVQETFKYRNDLLKPLFCWTHQKLRKIKKQKMTYGGCQKRLVSGFPRTKIGLDNELFPRKEMFFSKAWT